MKAWILNQESHGNGKTTKRAGKSLRKFQPSNTRAPPQPIVVTELLEHVQIDITDMRGNPDGGFEWILYIRDYVSKFPPIFQCLVRCKCCAN